MYIVCVIPLSPFLLLRALPVCHQHSWSVCLSFCFCVCVCVCVLSPAQMMRPPFTRSSSVCRSRRSLLSSQQPSLMSPDPDLLPMGSAPPPSYRSDATPEDEHIFFCVERKG